MRILILSDLHLEFQNFDPPKVDAEVVVLAGDIGLRVDGIVWAAEAFPDVPVVYVAGNHEFYDGGVVNAIIADMRLTARRFGVHFLDHDELVIDGVRFLGATLWTDFALHGADRAGEAMYWTRQYMADFKGAIARFTPLRSLALHEAAVEWLGKKLAEPFDGKTVVVTHHAPSGGSLHPRYAREYASAGFVSDLSQLMGPAALWIHGHCHDSFDYEINGTRIACNPRGYRLSNGKNENAGFNPGFVVEI